MSLVVRGLNSPLLQHCEMTVAGGEIAVLRGASGSGKTVLLRAIADLDPNDGEVLLFGTPRADFSGPQWRKHVRFVAAEAAWWSERVGDHFQAAKATEATATEVGMPGDCMGWQVARLSTGEKQRLGFLRAVEDRPRVLLLDEPTAALDEESERAVESVIVRLQSAGAVIVLVTHSDSQAERLASRHYLMENGRLNEGRW